MSVLPRIIPSSGIVYCGLLQGTPMMTTTARLVISQELEPIATRLSSHIPR